MRHLVVRHGLTNLRRISQLQACCVFIAAIAVLSVGLEAHGGSPFPIVTNKSAGNYVVSLWADPDASDDGDADGRFWVVVNPAAAGTALPSDTQVQLSIWPVEHAESLQRAVGQPSDNDPSSRSAAFVLDHEGRYGLKAAISGSLGPAELQTTVDAEFDERPGPILLAVYPMPFVLIGFVWIKLLIRRRGLGQAYRA